MLDTALTTAVSKGKHSAEYYGVHKTSSHKKHQVPAWQSTRQELNKNSGGPLEAPIPGFLVSDKIRDITKCPCPGSVHNAF